MCEGSNPMMWWGVGPRCVIINIYREYPAVISVPRPVRRMVQYDQLNREVIIISSPIRLGRGGSAKLARFEINHQVAIRGRIICRPRVSNNVRLCVRS